MSAETETAIDRSPAAPPADATGEDVTRASPTTQKRKAGDDRDDHDEPAPNSPNKRPRRDSDAPSQNGAARTSSPPAPGDAPGSSHGRRPSAAKPAASREEERKRGRRLFGGLLSTLSQTNSSTHQRKRQEIERRQHAKVSLQQAEDDKQREAKLDRLRQIRRRAQIDWEEKVMHTRHDHLLATAKFLYTRTQPRIYYLPWEPTADQEDLIADQVRDAEDIIERETREFKQRKAERLEALGEPARPASESDHAPKRPARRSPPPPSPPLEKGAAAEDEAEPSSRHKRPVGNETDTDQLLPGDPPPTHHDTSKTTNASSPTSAEQSNRGGRHQEREADEAGDVMVEGEEDTVIY